MRGAAGDRIARYAVREYLASPKANGLYIWSYAAQFRVEAWLEHAIKYPFEGSLTGADLRAFRSASGEEEQDGWTPDDPIS